jgi:hypothetical protein
MSLRARGCRTLFQRSTEVRPWTLSDWHDSRGNNGTCERRAVQHISPRQVRNWMLQRSHWRVRVPDTESLMIILTTGLLSTLFPHRLTHLAELSWDYLSGLDFEARQIPSISQTCFQEMHLRWWWELENWRINSLGHSICTTWAALWIMIEFRESQSPCLSNDWTRYHSQGYFDVLIQELYIVTTRRCFHGPTRSWGAMRGIPHTMTLFSSPQSPVASNPGDRKLPSAGLPDVG